MFATLVHAFLSLYYTNRVASFVVAEATRAVSSRRHLSGLVSWCFISETETDEPTGVYPCSAEMLHMLMRVEIRLRGGEIDEM